MSKKTDRITALEQANATVGEPLTPSDAEVERRLAEWLRPHFVGWVLW